MTLRTKTVLLLVATTYMVGCESSSMDRDLKRQADRSTMKLERLEGERNQLQTQLDKATTSLASEQKKSDAAVKETEDLRRRLAKAESDVLQSRQRIRELEEAALATRQGMPATRNVQP